MSKTPDTNTSLAPWLSPIVKKGKSRKIYVKTSSASTSTPSLSSPPSTWLMPDKIKCCRRRILLSVPIRSFKSQVTGYHEIAANPTPGDLVMSTAEEMQHPAYTMKESIGARYIFVGKVKYFTYIREAEGMK